MQTRPFRIHSCSGLKRLLPFPSFRAQPLKPRYRNQRYRNRSLRSILRQTQFLKKELNICWILPVAVLGQLISWPEMSCSSASRDENWQRHHLIFNVLDMNSTGRQHGRVPEHHKARGGSEMSHFVTLKDITKSMGPIVPRPDLRRCFERAIMIFG